MKQDNLPRISNYGEYSSDNYGAHTICVDIPASRKGKSGITLYFSYNTIIAFSGNIDGVWTTIVHKNDWGTTTGKHLNFISTNKDKRVDDETFNKLYKKAMQNA